MPAVQKQSLQKEGLVWRWDADLSGFFKRRHPHVRSTRIGGGEQTEAHDEGRAAGWRIVIHRPVDSAERRELPKESGHLERFIRAVCVD